VVLDEHQTEPLIHSVLDELFERHYANAAAHSDGVRDLVRLYGSGRDDSIRRLVVDIHRHSQALVSPARWFQEQFAAFRDSTPGLWRDTFIQGSAQWANLWRDALASVAGDNSNLAACLNALNRLPATATTFKDVATLLERIVAADARKWESGSKTKIRKPFQSFFEDARFLQELARDNGAPLQQDWSWVRHHMLSLLELAQEFTAAFSRAKQELGGVDFADQEQLALRLLYDENEKPTDIAFACRERFRFVFVDECQDINAAQDAILRAVSREGANANRFLVGDVKQSIYRFRLADPRIFQRYEATWSAKSNAQDGGRVLPLTENFRSREALLNFVNTLFRALMRPVIGELSYGTQAELKFGNRGGRTELSLTANIPEKEIEPRVEVHVITKEDDLQGTENGALVEGVSTEMAELQAVECEARLVAQRLRNLERDRHPIWDDKQKCFRPVEWRDIVVLMRGVAGRAEVFAKAFHQADVPLHAERAGFLDAVEITDLLNLLRLLDNPLQDVPLLAVLRSPLVGISPDELVSVRLTQKNGPLWTALVRNAKSAEGNPRLKRFLVQFARWRELIRHTSVTHCLETALAETHYEALLLAGERGKAQVANVRRLIDMARRFDPYQREGLFRFLQFIAEQEETEVRHESARLAQENAVRLMTIHASKGLEFPVVVLAGLGCRFNLRDLSDDILMNEDLGLCPKVLPPESRCRYPSITHWAASERERRALLGEEMRLLYVALTRAKDTLILTGTASRQDEAERWRQSAPITDFALVKASCCLDWLRLWFSQHAKSEEWSDDHSGMNELLSWEFKDRNDPVFEPKTVKTSRLERDLELPADGELRSLKALLAWQYPNQAATREPAKTSVSTLRRRAIEADEEATAGYPFQLTAKRVRIRRAESAKLSGADVGIAHHTFMQFVSLDCVASERDLRREAERMHNSGAMTAAEIAVLDLKAVMAFWQTDLGSQLLSQRENLQREMPFTARITTTELRALNVDIGNPTDARSNEFVVVQGIVDLAVILPKEIWLLDFKTDDVRISDLQVKTKLYEPQLKLYSMALSGIYRRDVTQRWLHFLSCRKTIQIER
jgi:ATP-dependent helicase/nuclease subunit A